MAHVSTGHRSRRILNALRGAVTRFSFGATALAAGVGLCILARPAQAIPIDFDFAFKGPRTPSMLSGAYYDFRGPFNTAAAVRHVRANSPRGTFKARRIDFPAPVFTPTGTIDRDTIRDVNVATFLSRNATDLNPPMVFNDPVTTSLFYFTGLLEIRSHDDLIPAPLDDTGNIDVRFALGSDDGSLLRIAGIDIINNDGEHGFRFGPVAEVEFERPGLYPIEVFYYNNQAHAGVELFSTICCAPGAGGPSRAPELVPDSRLFQPPRPRRASEPAALLLLAVGAASMAGVCRRRST